MNENPIVRIANNDDIESIANIHQQSFERQFDSYTWVKSTLAAWPRFMVYVILNDVKIVGYIFWQQKSGIRTRVILELDQIAIQSDFRGKGLGEILIKNSLTEVENLLRNNDQTIKSILVSTRDDNKAKQLYKKVLNSKEVAKIANLYSSTEVLMLSE